MSIFLDIKRAALTVDRLIHADGSLSLSIEDLETMAKRDRKVMPARDKIHSALLGLGYKRTGGGRYAISATDDRALCQKTRDDFVAACEKERVGA